LSADKHGLRFNKRKNWVDNVFLKKYGLSKENMRLLGYAYLHAHLGLTAFEPAQHARLGAVTPVSRLIWATLWLCGGIIFLTICSLNCGP
jgi:hypothetical protein